MEENTRHRHSIDLFCVISLFLLFVLAAMLVVVLGSNIYAGSVRGMSEHGEVRTAVSYITQKVRQDREQGAVTVETFGGSDALVLSENADGAAYETRLYLYDGQLMELLAVRGSDLSPDAGSPVMAMDSLSFRMLSPALLRVTGTCRDGETISFCLSLLPSGAAEGGAQ